MVGNLLNINNIGQTFSNGLNAARNFASDVGQGIAYTATPEGLRQLPGSVNDAFQQGTQAVGNGIRNFVGSPGGTVGGPAFNVDRNNLKTYTDPAVIIYTLVSAAAGDRSAWNTFVGQIRQALGNLDGSVTAFRDVSVNDAKSSLVAVAGQGQLTDILKSQLSGQTDPARESVNLVLQTFQNTIANMAGIIAGSDEVINKLNSWGVSQFLGGQPASRENPSAVLDAAAKGNQLIASELDGLSNSLGSRDKIHGQGVQRGKTYLDKTIQATATNAGGGNT